jgi:hypothetical protein
METQSVHLMLERPEVARQHLTDAEQAVSVVRKSRILLVPFAQFPVD